MLLTFSSNRIYSCCFIFRQIELEWQRKNGAYKWTLHYEESINPWGFFLHSDEKKRFTIQQKNYKRYTQLIICILAGLFLFYFIFIIFFSPPFALLFWPSATLDEWKWGEQIAQRSKTRTANSKKMLEEKQQDRISKKKKKKNGRKMYVVFFFFVFLFKNANILKLTSFINLRVCAMHADIPFFNIRSDFNVLKLFVFVNLLFFLFHFVLFVRFAVTMVRC